MTIFHGPRGEPTPAFRGDFDCHVDMPIGIGTKPVVTADLTAVDGAGQLATVPYPVDHLAGQLHVRDGYVDLDRVTMRHGPATLAVGGRVSWHDRPGNQPADVHPDLTVAARDVPIDADLLAVLPPAASRALADAGVAGLLDVDGRLTAGGSDRAAGFSRQSLPAEAGSPAGRLADLTYDLAVALHGGSARPHHGELTITDLSAALAVRPDRVEVRSLHGRRGTGTVSGSATVDLPTDGPAVVHLSGSAHDLPLDRPLHDLLPAGARDGWDALLPRGRTDADVTATLIADGGRTPPAWRLTLRPRGDLAVRPVAIPYSLDHVSGTVVVDPVAIDIQAIYAQHGSASFALAGHGLTRSPDRWDLTLSAHDVPADADLRRALPPALRATVDRAKLHGRLDAALTTLDYRGGAANPQGGPTSAADMELGGTLWMTDASMDVGVPVEHLTGSARFGVAVRDGRVSAADGDLDLASLSLADRPVSHLRARVHQAHGSDTLAVSDVQADLAGGRLAGKVDLRFPTDPTASTTAPTTDPASAGGYAVAFAVTDADVATIAGSAVPGDKPIAGKLSASLDLQGDWGDPASRNGRGDVLVEGRQLYQIPLVLGLLEVTDLALPTSAPFNQATARYAVHGRRVTFENLQMRGDGLVMSGAGWLDFASKRVRMNFTTESPRSVRVPVLHDLWQGAKRELLQIQVRGTVQDPKVSAASLHTFTTTVDEVLRGSGEDDDR